MSEKTATDIIKSKNEALSLLPDPYRKLTDDVLAEENVKLGIEALKEIYADKGGIHLCEVDDYQVLMRVANDTILDQAFDKGKKMSATESDRWLIGQVLLYPNAEVFAVWLKQAPGLAAPFARKQFELAKANQVASAKKL